MKPEPISLAEYRDAFEAARMRAERAALACVREPTPDAIHEARISVRKVMAALSLLPRRPRNTETTLKAKKRLRVFYKACAKIRDIDAITGALSGENPGPGLDGILRNLESERAALLASAVKSAKKVPGLRLRAPDGDTRIRLRKRLNKLLTERAGRAAQLQQTAAKGEKRVAELHRLRKECRRIKYLLDFAVEDEMVDSAQDTLERAREKLGSIRNDDLLMEALKGAKGRRCAELAEAVAAARSARFREFFLPTQRPGGGKRLASLLRGLA
jgi:CHAD domain-containing protein